MLFFDNYKDASSFFLKKVNNSFSFKTNWFFVFNSGYKKKMNNFLKLCYFSHSDYFELYWSVLPISMVLSMLFSSLSLLYSVDGAFTSLHSVQVMDNQWF